MNTFDDAKTVEEVIFQAIGAGSTCWENLGGTGTFQDDRARRLGEDAMARLRCDEDCGAETLAHAADEHEARARSNFVLQHGKLLCPRHRLY